jgi:hypothetical protein
LATARGDVGDARTRFDPGNAEFFAPLDPIRRVRIRRGRRDSARKPGGGDAFDGGGSRVAVAAAPAGAVAAVGTERGGGDGFAGDDRPSDAASGALGEAVSPGTRDATDARDTRGATEG